MLPKSYNMFHGPCLNTFPQVWLLGYQRYHPPQFIYINQSDEVSHLVRIRKFLGGMKYLTRSVKIAAEAVGIWTKENWGVKRVNSLFTMVSGNFNFKINKGFDSLSWLSVFRDFYTRRGYII